MDYGLWILDVMFDFKEFNGGPVLMADNIQCDIKQIGKIKFRWLWSDTHRC